MAQAAHPNSTNLRWWSLAQILVWIIQRIEMLPWDAEQACYAPEIGPEIEGALNTLTRALFNVISGMPIGVIPIVGARIRCGGSYVNLVSLFQPQHSPGGGASDALMNEIRRVIEQPDVEYNRIWAQQAWPVEIEAEAPLSRRPDEVIAQASVPVQGASEPPSENPSPTAAPPAGMKTALTAGGGRVNVGDVDPMIAHAIRLAIGTPMPAPQTGEAEWATLVARAALVAPPPSEQLVLPVEPPKREEAAEAASKTSVEKLTYAQIAERIGRSPDAVRSLVTRRHLPRTIGGDGKALVTVSQEILDQLQSDQSSDNDRPITTRSPGGDRPIAGVEAASLPPGELPEATPEPQHAVSPTSQRASQPSTEPPPKSDPALPADTTAAEARTEVAEALQEPERKVAETPQGKGPGGTHPTWDWTGIIALLKQRKAGEGPFKGTTTFKNKATFKQFIQKHVQHVDGSDRGDGPDPSTVRRAITTHHLEQYVTFEIKRA